MRRLSAHSALSAPARLTRPRRAGGAGGRSTPSAGGATSTLPPKLLAGFKPITGGTPVTGQAPCIVLVLGETGSGKSTFINACVNFFRSGNPRVPHVVRSAL